MSIFKRIWTACLAAVLCSCGGGGGEQIFEVQAAPLAYGITTSIAIAGANLRSDMVITTGACQNPVFSSSSTPSGAIAKCKITTTGSQPLTITNAQGQLVYSTTLAIPQPQVTMLTSMGTVVLELDPSAAPATVDNFLSYVHAGFYSGTLFHRVIPGFVVQGGGFTAGLVPLATAAPIRLESNNGLFNTRGAIAMARTGAPDSATSQFFINLADNTSLDYQNATNPGYAVFGKVVQGMDVVDAIGAVKTGVVNGYGDVPIADVTITAAGQTR